MNIRLVLFLLSLCVCLSAQAQNPRYQLIQGDFNWFEAKLDAEKRGGHLVTITSQQEWDTIRAIVPPSVLEGKTIWIGGTDSRVEGQWEWVTGEPWGGFVNWRGGEPNGTGGGGESDFIEMTHLSGSPWNDAFGSEKRQYYLLEYEFPLPTPRYQLIQGIFTWSEANLDAARRGGHLATITSEEEWRTVTGLFGSNLLDAFLGGTDEAQEGVWRWVTGEPWGFEKWHSGQPDNSSGVQDYLWLHPAYSLDWDDADGNSKSKYLLEIESTPLPPVQMEFVTVGDPGNPPDSTGYGKVDYVFQIGKFEVNNLQYAAFLNAKAKSDSHSLYNPTGSPGNGIVRSGTDGSFSYSIKSGMEQKPVTFVNFYKAMRFANWLHNGGQVSSDTETGAYTFGSNGALPTKRNLGAKYFVPSENEWYKAAYYQPASAGGSPNNYWQYATRSNVAPVAEPPPGRSNSANYESALPSSNTLAPLTDVGAYVLASSYYGTFDQTGNVWEWNETALLGGRSIRGGSIGEPASKIGSQFRFDNFNDGAGWEQGCCGFRLAAAFPPPPISSPAIVSQPQSQSVVAGNPVTFSATATGTSPLTYQWRKGGVNISNATLSTYTISNVQTAEAGLYSVVISNAAGAVVSDVATLTVLNPPAITTQPQSQSVVAGNPITFSATATGTSPLTYQWRKGGVNISSATLNTYTISNVQTAEAGLYSVVISNAAGAVVSSAATLTVLTPSPLVNAFNLSRLSFGPTQGLRIPLSPPDRTAFAIETSPDLKTWTPLITFPSNSGPFEFIDSSAVGQPLRFYRAVKR